jgi:hypothetical protein
MIPIIRLGAEKVREHAVDETSQAIICCILTDCYLVGKFVAPTRSLAVLLTAERHATRPL